MRHDGIQWVKRYTRAFGKSARACALCRPPQRLLQHGPDASRNQATRAPVCTCCCLPQTFPPPPMLLSLCRWHFLLGALLTCRVHMCSCKHPRTRTVPAALAASAALAGRPPRPSDACCKRSHVRAVLAALAASSALAGRPPRPSDTCCKRSHMCMVPAAPAACSARFSTLSASIVRVHGAGRSSGLFRTLQHTFRSHRVVAMRVAILAQIPTECQHAHVSAIMDADAHIRVRRHMRARV